MTHRKHFVIALILICGHRSLAQNDHRAEIDTVPFLLTEYDNIAISGFLNESDSVVLMFHTAALDLGLTSAFAESVKGIHWNSTEEANSWGGNGQTRYSASNSLRIGSFVWDSIPLWENQRSGHGTDGKFGPNLFEGKAVEIDFDKRLMIIHDLLPPKTSDYEKLPLIYEDGFMFLELTSKVGETEYTNKFLIHSGYSGTILYDDAFVARTKIGNLIEIIDEQELKDSGGNTVVTKRGRLPWLSIGSRSFQDIGVGFFEGTIGRQQMSVMGAGLLKRFNLIISADRESMYVSANGFTDLPFEP